METVAGWRGEINIPGLTQVRPDLLVQVAEGSLGAGTYSAIVVSVSGQSVSNFRRFCQSRSVLNSVMAEPVSFGEYGHENPRWTG